MIVQEELEKLELHPVNIELGVAEIMEDISQKQYDELKVELYRDGLELMDDRKNILTEKVKNVIVEMIHYCDDKPKVKYSDYISERLQYDYTYISNVFSKVKGTTIRQFIINNKVEKVKELLLYDELNIKEISFRLHYSSVAHLSGQFKKITGFSPYSFKIMNHKRTVALECL
jgi:AraC-like DNA-binding protein